MTRAVFPELLLGDHLAPITSEIGFIEADLATSVGAFLEWAQPLEARQDATLAVRDVRGDLEALLRALLPLTSLEARRALFVPTAGPWTAYFDNGHHGPDAGGSPMVVAERLGCRGLRVVAEPDRIGDRPRSTRGHGAVILALYGPGPDDAREIYAAKNGGGWEFGQHGPPLPFEDPARYRARRVRDRFTWELLRDYCAALGVRALDERFYAPSGTATLIEKVGPTFPGSKEYTLAEAQALFSPVGPSPSPPGEGAPRPRPRDNADARILGDHTPEEA